VDFLRGARDGIVSPSNLTSARGPGIPGPESEERKRRMLTPAAETGQQAIRVSILVDYNHLPDLLPARSAQRPTRSKT